MACSNSHELETGEMRTIELIQQAINQSNKKELVLNVKKIFTRELIDSVGSPILYVELENGQNGTLDLYPGNGIGDTWLAADGATITFKHGVLKSSRGMGDDLMCSRSNMPMWSEITTSANYDRKILYLSGNNQIYSEEYNCKINKTKKDAQIIIFDLSFVTDLYEETCKGQFNNFNNKYYIDHQQIVRRSYQYHGKTIGYILTERLER